MKQEDSNELNITVKDIYNRPCLPKHFKIVRNAERFWVRPMNKKYYAIVLNDLIFNKWKCGDRIRVHPNEKVYDVDE